MIHKALRLSASNDINYHKHALGPQLCVYVCEREERVPVNKCWKGQATRTCTKAGSESDGVRWEITANIASSWVASRGSTLCYACTTRPFKRRWGIPTQMSDMLPSWVASHKRQMSYHHCMKWSGCQSVKVPACYFVTMRQAASCFKVPQCTCVYMSMHVCAHMCVHVSLLASQEIAHKWIISF